MGRPNKPLWVEVGRWMGFSNFMIQEAKFAVNYFLLVDRGLDKGIEKPELTLDAAKYILKIAKMHSLI